MAIARNSYGAAAAKIGISTDEYVAKRAAGLRWCSTHKAWHPEAEFTPDTLRGRMRVCRESRRRVAT